MLFHAPDFIDPLLPPPLLGPVLKCAPANHGGLQWRWVAGPVNPALRVPSGAASARLAVGCPAAAAERGS